VDAFYDSFITEVSKSRKLTKEAVDKIARGRVWSGQDAVERGLVDKLGGMFDAIDAARRRAKIADSEPLDLAIYGEPHGLLTALADRDSFVAKLLGGSPPSTEWPEGVLMLAREMGLEQALMLQPNLKAMMPFTLKVE
jgi:protease-4